MENNSYQASKIEVHSYPGNNQSQSNSKSEVELRAFDESAKGTHIYVQKASARYREIGTIVMIDKSLIESQKVVFRIRSFTNDLFMIGACQKKYVADNDFFFRRDMIGLHRLYITDCEGYCLVDRRRPGFIGEEGKFKMGINDLIEVSLDKQKRAVVVCNATESRTLSLPLSGELEIEDLFACVYLGWKGDSVEIINYEQCPSHPIRFDVENPFRPNFEVRDNTITLINDIDAQIAFVAKSLVDEPSCLFRIWQKKSTKLGIGLASKSKVRSNCFSLDLHSTSSNCLLFHSDGTVTNTLSGAKSNKSLDDFNLEEGDQILLSYLSDAKVLRAQINSKGAKTEIETSVELEHLGDYSFCALLLATGDEIRM